MMTTQQNSIFPIFGQVRLQWIAKAAVFISLGMVVGVSSLQAANLVARWQLNESSPPYSDSGPNGIALTYDPATSDPTSSSLSIEGLAAQLTSASGTVTRLSATNAALQNDSFGFSFWLNPVNLDYNTSLLAKEMPFNNALAPADRLSWQLYVGNGAVGGAGLTLVVRGNDRSQGDFFRRSSVLRSHPT